MTKLMHVGWSYIHDLNIVEYPDKPDACNTINSQIYLSPTLGIYFHVFLVSVTAGGPVSP